MTTGIFTPAIDGDIGFTEDVKQFSDLLTGQRDGGALAVGLAALSSPASAPTITTQSGSITGTGYKWAVYWITGIQSKNQSSVIVNNIVGRTLAGTLTAGQALSSNQATVSISGFTVPTGVIGWGVVRNKSGGSSYFEVPGSEQFLTAGGSLPATFVDNQIDANLVTAAPASNTTGTSLDLPGGPLVVGSNTQVGTTPGAIEIQRNVNPVLYLTDTSQVAPAGRWGVYTGSDKLVFLRNATDMAWVTNAGQLVATGGLAGGSGIFGSSFPASPVSGQLFWLDTGNTTMPFFYDGTHWYSQVFRAPILFSTVNQTDVTTVTEINSPNYGLQINTVETAAAGCTLWMRLEAQLQGASTKAAHLEIGTGATGFVSGTLISSTTGGTVDIAVGTWTSITSASGDGLGIYLGGYRDSGGGGITVTYYAVTAEWRFVK